MRTPEECVIETIIMTMMKIFLSTTLSTPASVINQSEENTRNVCYAPASHTTSPSLLHCRQHQPGQHHNTIIVSEWVSLVLIMKNVAINQHMLQQHQLRLSEICAREFCGRWMFWWNVLRSSRLFVSLCVKCHKSELGEAGRWWGR